LLRFLHNTPQNQFARRLSALPFDAETWHNRIAQWYDLGKSASLTAGQSEQKKRPGSITARREPNVSVIHQAAHRRAASCF